MAHAVEELALRLCGFLELTVGFHELAGSQRHFGLETLLLLHHALEPDPLQSHPVGYQPEHDQCVDGIGPRRAPWRGVAVQLQTQRRLAPNRVGIGRAHLEQVITGIQVGQ